jgi:hypothetical protein
MRRSLSPIPAILCAVWLLGALAAGAAHAALTLYVAPNGSDAWTGRVAAPNAAGTDGPLASILGARDMIRTLRAGGAAEGGVTVLVRGGTYRMAAPLVLEPRDSGEAGAPVVYGAYPGEKPVLSGGEVIGGWERGEGGVWRAQVPGREFQQLFVNGQRRTRARTPNEGYFHIVAQAPPAVDPVTGAETVQDRTAFMYEPGDLKPWPNPSDVHVVFYHSWETARLRIASVDEGNQTVHFTGPSWWNFNYFGAHRRYYVENAPDALDAPGEWYLDSREGVVSYLPLPGEDMATAEVVAPRLRELVRLAGDAELGVWVENVEFRGLQLSDEDWVLEPEGHSDAQAVVGKPAAVMADGAYRCAFEDCEISRVGDSAIWLRRGCRENRVVRCRLHDLGVGGVKIGETSLPRSDAETCWGNVVDNNHIYDSGYVYPAGVGVLVLQASESRITHNAIHDLGYSGVSVGWAWGDEPTRCHGNIIEGNHIHHVMRQQLSDGGAIYTLGVSTGSVIRGNLLHDVWCFDDPPYAWGVYLDATTSGYLVEGNVVYNCRTGGLMMANGGHSNVVRDNVFAYCAEYALWPFWPKDVNTFERNVVVMDRGKWLVEGSEVSQKQRLAAGESLGTWNHNVYWDTRGTAPLLYGHDLAAWQALGLDTESVVADPQFVDAEGRDLRLRETSPALALGIKTVDVSGAGLYGDPAWVAEAKAVTHPPTVFPAPAPEPGPALVNDDFEATVAGANPDGARISGEQRGASIRVSREMAASGDHSVKVTDAPGLPFDWEPHFFYQPHLKDCEVVERFQILLEPETRLYTEWRDEGAYPDCVGPNLVFSGTGEVVANGQRLGTVPVGVWLGVEVRCQVGAAGTGTYTVSITGPDGAAQRWDDLPYVGKAFRRVEWLGFVSMATVKAETYLDDIRVGPAD